MVGQSEEETDKHGILKEEIWESIILDNISVKQYLRDYLIWHR